MDVEGVKGSTTWPEHQAPQLEPVAWQAGMSALTRSNCFLLPHGCFSVASGTDRPRRFHKSKPTHPWAWTLQQTPSQAADVFMYLGEAIMQMESDVLPISQ